MLSDRIIVIAQAWWSVEGMTAKDKIRELVESQPDDASYDEILRELAFQRMVERGLSDARRGRVISNDQMGEQIRRWRA
jgi:predicted transcriptional regulator